MADNNLQILYDTVSKDYDLGTYDDFLGRMQDKRNRAVFFQTVSPEFDLGNDFRSFDRKIILPIVEGSKSITPKPFSVESEKSKREDDSEIDEKEYPETKKDPTWKQFINSLGAGSSQLGSQVVRIPGAVVDITNIPTNFIFDLVGKPEWKQEAPDWLLDNPVANYYDRQTEVLKAKNTSYEKDIIDLWGQGKVADGFHKLGNMVAEGIPTFVGITAATASGVPFTATMGTVGLGVAGQKRSQLKAEEVPIDILKQQINAFNDGALEGITEALGTGTITKIGTGLIQKFGKEKGSEILKKGISETIKKYFEKFYTLTAPLGEGIEEYANQIAGNINDYMSGVSKSTNFTSGATDAFFTGMATSAGPAVGVKTIEALSKGSEKSDTVKEYDNRLQEGDNTQGKETTTSKKEIPKQKAEIDPRTALQKAAEEIGIDIYDGQGNFRKPGELADLIQRQRKFTSEEGQQKLDELETKAEERSAKNPETLNKLNEQLREESIDSGLKSLDEKVKPTAESVIKNIKSPITKKLIEQGRKKIPQLEQVDELANYTDKQLQEALDELNKLPKVSFTGDPKTDTEIMRPRFAKDLITQALTPVHKEIGEDVPQPRKRIEEIRNKRKEPIVDQESFKEAIKREFKYNDKEANAVSVLMEARAETAVSRGTHKSKKDYYKSKIQEIRRGTEAQAEALKQQSTGKPLFQGSLRVETTPEQLEQITKKQWNEISRFMKERGYDYRGGEDAKMLFLKRGGKSFTDDQALALQKIAGIEGTKQKGSGIVTEKTDSQIYIEGEGWFHRSIVENMGYDFNKIKVDDVLSEFQKEETPSRYNFDDNKKTNVEKKSLKEFGITDDFNEAGYLTLGGDLLDFSGKKQGGEPGERSLDHREINGDYTHFDEFRAMGNIRMKPESSGFEVWTNPTLEQKKVLKRYIREYGTDEGIMVDFVEDSSNRSVSIEYNPNTKPEKVFKDIKDFFDGKEVQPQSKLSRFRGDTLFQNIKGATQFQADGRAIIHAFESADASTAIHELAHVWRRDLDATDNQALIDDYNKQNKSNKKTIDVDVEEHFAKGFEKYVLEGKAPNSKLQQLFNDFSIWLWKIYNGLHHDLSKIQITPELKNIFDRLLDADVTRITPEVTNVTESKPKKVVDLTNKSKNKSRQYDDSTVKGWIRSEGGIKSTDLAAHGIAVNEDRSLFLALARKDGVSLDELAERAISAGVIREDTYFNPSDNLIQAVRDDALNNIYTNIEDIAEQRIFREYYEEALNEGAIPEDMTLDEFKKLNDEMVSQADKLAGEPLRDEDGNVLFQENLFNRIPAKKIDIEKDFVNKKAKEGVDVTKLQTMQTKLANRLKEEESRKKEEQSGQKNLFVEAEKDKQQTLFQEAPPTGSKAFKKWFDDSKAVDREGDPLVLYHGAKSDFTTFEKNLLGSSTGSASAREGFFFVSNKNVADGYSNFAKNEKVVDDLIKKSEEAENRARKETGDKAKKIWETSERLMRQAEELEQEAPLKSSIIEAYLSIKNPLVFDAENRNFFDVRDEIHKAIKNAKKSGNDGVIFKNLEDNADFGSGTIADHYLVFEPTQIKSATGNKGTFDPNNPNILFQEQQEDMFEESEKAKFNGQMTPEQLANMSPEQLQKIKKKTNVPKKVYNEATKDAEKTKTAVNHKNREEKFQRAGMIGKALAPISTRLNDIAPKIFRALRTFEYSVNQRILKDTEAILPLMNATKKFSKDDRIIFDLAQKNGDLDMIMEIVNKYGVKDEYNAARQALDNIYNRAIEVGIDTGYRVGYFPRKLKDSTKFLEFLHQEYPGNWGAIEEAWAAKKEQIGRDLSDNEKAHIANMTIRGYGKQITLQKAKNFKERQIEVIDSKINEFYYDTNAALMKYIHETNSNIESRRLFGKDENSDESIGRYVQQLVDDGELNPVAQNEVIEILRSRFNFQYSGGPVSLFKNIGYITSMGSPTSAITQIGDMAWAMYAAGPKHTLKALGQVIAHKDQITREDIGIERIGEEFADMKTLAKTIDKVFTITGLKSIDRLGKETLINAVVNKTREELNNEKLSFNTQRRLKKHFGNETAQLVKDIKAGVLSENVKLYAFNTLLDYQPVALSEMPQKYLDAPNGRILYMLKTFTIKSMDVFRNESIKLIRSKNPKERAHGIKNMAYLGGMFVLLNASADEIKDWMLDRETSLDDRIVDNVLRLMGISKYIAWQARDHGVEKAITKMIAPPFDWLDVPYRDIKRAIKKPQDIKVNDLESIKLVPVVGKFWYWQYGRGSKIERKYNYREDFILDTINSKDATREQVKESVSMLRRERKRLVDELKDYQESGYKEGQKEVKQHLNKLDRLFKHLERKTK